MHMVEGGRTKTSALQRLTRWPTTSPSSSMANWSESKKHGVSIESSYFQPINHENLIQGSLYIMKLKIVTISLFEGWNDDMCCFSVLRSDTGSMRWSEARYLPGDFDAFEAFDDAGNPPVYFWTRYLRIQVPVNWFSLFEEARRRQRMWNMDIQRHYIYQQQQQQQQEQEQEQEHVGDEDDMLSFPAPPSSISSLPLNDTNDDDCYQSNTKNSQGTNTNDPLHISTSFSQSRHGAPTIFSDLHTTPAPITTPVPLNDLRPSKSSSSSSSSSSTSPPLLSSSSSIKVTPQQQLVYSPTPSLRHASVAKPSNITRPQLGEKDFLQTDHYSTITKKTNRRSVSIKTPSNKKQQQRKSVLGLF